MSAVLEPQGTLDGIPPVQTPATDMQVLRVAALGVLAHSALVRRHHDGTVCVEVVVNQQVEHHPRALPLFGAFSQPDQGCIDATIAAARKKAASLAEGTEVMLLGRGLELSRHDGRDVFRVLHVDALDLTTKTH